MPDSVASALKTFSHFAPGDIIALNDPFLGGSHLPDITIIAPIFVQSEGEQRLLGFAANRAHHADVGGMSPGSMPMASEIYQEGVILPPIKLWEVDRPNQVVLELILRNVRTPQERRGDLAAQIAANRTAIGRIQELTERWTFSTIEEHSDALIAYAERMTRATIAALLSGSGGGPADDSFPRGRWLGKTRTYTQVAFGQRPLHSIITYNCIVRSFFRGT
jgi:N-methylhydantoinase B